MTPRSRSRDSAREILDALVRDVQRSEFRPLSADYLRAVDRVEKLPGNRTGADMTHWFGQHQVPTEENREARRRELAA